VVLDLRLPDMSGFEVLECLRDTPSLNDLRWLCSPEGAVTGRRRSLHALARSVVVKGGRVARRLLDETVCFCIGLSPIFAGETKLLDVAPLG